MRLTVLAALLVSLAVMLFAQPITEMFHEEIRTRLSRLPNALIFLIALRLPREIRRDLVDEWTAELEAVVSDIEGLPVTRLLAGLEYAWGLYRFQRLDGRRLTGTRRWRPHPAGPHPAGPHPAGPLPPLPDDDYYWGAEPHEARVRRLGYVRATLLAIAPVFALVIVAIGGVGYHYYRTYITPPDFSGSGTGSVVVQIRPGQSATAVGDRLAALGVVASAQAFSNAANSSPEGEALDPGTYRVHKHMNASLALALLLDQTSRASSS